MSTIKQKLKRVNRAWWIALGVIVVLLIGIRIALPHVALHYVNKSLNDMEGYRGLIADIDMNLYRGAYVIEGIKIVSVNKGVETPFVEIKKVDISIEWSALLNGSIVGEVIFEQPRINFVAGDEVEEAQTGTGVDWRQQVKDIVPLKINRVELVNGSVHYMEPKGTPPLDIYVDDLNVVVNNLTNSTDLSETLVSDATLSARVMSHAALRMSGKIDPFDSLGTFDMNVELEDFEVAELNDFLEEYVKLDVESGTFSLYAEATASNGDFEGYVKPLINNLVIVKRPEDGGLLKRAWERIVQITANIFENRKTDNVGSKVPLSGNLQNPDFNLIATVTSLVRNAFFQALLPNLENEITLDAVESEMQENGTPQEEGKTDKKRQSRKDRKNQ